MNRLCLAALLGAGLLAVAWAPSPAAADQARDFMFSAPPTGDFLMLDFFGTGGQLSYEKRVPIYGDANSLAVGAQTLLAYPLGQAQAYARVRILFLELGVVGGYRATWRNLSFAPGKNGEYCQDCDRSSRRTQDPILASGPDTDRFGYAEAQATLYFPFNENLVLTSELAARYEDARPRSFDWFFTDIHDGGVISRSETSLFVHHRDWGGIAPYLQLMFLPRDGQHVTEIAYGLNATMRLGLLARNDLLFLTFLIRPGDRYYGEHSYYSPVRALLIYRMILDL